MQSLEYDPEDVEHEGDCCGNLSCECMKGSIRKAVIKKAIRNILISIGEDPNREGLKDTPQRVADMYYDELFSGYNANAELDVTFQESGDMVILKNIPFVSFCEHHLLSFSGQCSIAYISSGKVFGVSKLARLVQKYAKRLQVQERMTQQIADELYTTIQKNSVPSMGVTQHIVNEIYATIQKNSVKPDELSNRPYQVPPMGVVVVVEAEHSCMKIRGVKTGGTMVTSAIRGKFVEEPEAKAEALELMRN